MSEANVETVRRGYEAVARGDFEVIRDSLDPKVRWHGGDASAPGSCHNRDQVIEFMRRAREQGGFAELVDVVDAGEHVVVILRRTSPAGENQAPHANLTTFRDGKVIEMVHYDDADEALAAIRGRS